MGRRSTHASAAHAAALVLALKDHDLDLQPTSISPPITEHEAELLTHPLIAPWHAIINLHSSAAIHMEEAQYVSSPLRLAYVTHVHTKGWGSQIVKRLRPFTYVIPADEQTHRVLDQRQIKNLLGPATITELAEFIEAVGRV